MRRGWLWLAAAAVLALVWGLAAFAQTAEGRIARLPALVHAELAAHGDRFIGLKSISPWVLDAVVATEDQTFWTNPGISFEGTLRALFVDLETRSFAEGGSTITQQLARDRFLGDQKTLRRKLAELAYAVLITRRYPKREILDLYLNQAYFGNGAFGIESAARTYFALPARDLDLAQSAMVVGVLDAPTAYDPLQHLQAARARQRHVLQEMVSVGKITPAMAKKAVGEALDLVRAR